MLTKVNAYTDWVEEIEALKEQRKQQKAAVQRWYGEDRRWRIVCVTLFHWRVYDHLHRPPTSTEFFTPGEVVRFMAGRKIEVRP